MGRPLHVPKLPPCHRPRMSEISLAPMDGGYVAIGGLATIEAMLRLLQWLSFSASAGAENTAMHPFKHPGKTLFAARGTKT